MVFRPSLCGRGRRQATASEPMPAAMIAVISRCIAAAFVAAVLVALPEPAHAYIGPGAGFAFAGSLLAMVAAIGLALGSILLWPITFIWRTIRVGNPFKH